MNMIEKYCICEPARCTSCGACVAKCKDKRIKMKDTISGFRIPMIEDGLEQCNNCNFVCPQLYNNALQKPRNILAIQLIDKLQLLKSTSGGMFYALAKYVIDQKGVVYGAVFDENMYLYHKDAHTLDEIVPMHGSKYVQSDIEFIFEGVENELRSNKSVLFTGLPCQIAGLKAYLQCDYKNLITMELICNGVPSRTLFSSYIKYEENKRNIKILDYKFRDKNKNGLSHTVVIKYKDNDNKIKYKTISDRRKVSYYVAFGKRNCFMDACYDCKYNRLERISDFTAGGFWSISRIVSNMSEREGVSLVLVNSEKGERIFNYIKCDINYQQTSIDIAVIGNPALYESTPISNKSKDLYNDLLNYGYKYTSNKYFKARKGIFLFAVNMIRRLQKLYKRKH